MRKHTCTHAPNTVQMCSLEEILFSGLVLSQSSGKQARALGARGSFREESCQRSLHSPCESDLCYEQSVTANKTSTFNNPSSQVLFLHIFQSVCTVQNHTTQVNKTRKVKGPSQTGQAHAATSNPKHHPGWMLRKRGELCGGQRGIVSLSILQPLGLHHGFPLTQCSRPNCVQNL